MKYIISENRLIKLMKNFMAAIAPDFTKKNVSIHRTITQLEQREVIGYYDKKGSFLAAYHKDIRELQLSKEIFNDVEGYFDDDMTIVIDWFNEEFRQDAECVTF